MAEQVLIYGDTVRSPELRHEVPLLVGDPFLYAERDGTRYVLTNVLEATRIGEVGSYEVHLSDEYGLDELIKQGRKPDEIRNELLLRACRAFGIDDAVVPFWFPLQLADFLRENGIQLRPDHELFDDRRRVKNAAEIEGIRRAQGAAEAGMGAARDLLAAAEQGNGTVTVDGEPLTSERIKLAIGKAFTELDCTADEFIVAHGPQGARGHDMGSGPIALGEAVVIDLWPKDRESACFADMTRTFVVGEPPEEIVEWQRLCKEALDRSLAAVKAGVKGREVYDVSCDVFEGHGYPTQRTKEAGKPLHEGFFHGLGHGVGLEVHEEPGLGFIGQKELLPGDVVTIEPGLYRQGFGGVRLEDLVLVTEDGAENLTDFPYDLEP
jgi:Xaa-Pro aminopeptidase